MSFLERAKQAEARLRAERDVTRGDATNAVNAVSGGPLGVVSSPPVDAIAAYSTALHKVWRLAVLGPGIDGGTAIQAINEVVRLIDAVGEPTATELRHRLETEWHRDTGRCPRCGERGKCHT